MAMVNTRMQPYGETWYWDNRYAHESGCYDWYQKYNSLAPLIHLYIPHHHHRILVVGCGNSGTAPISFSKIQSFYCITYLIRN